MKWFSAASALLASTASAQLVTYSDKGTGITHSLSIPDSTASMGSGPIFFQLMGPASFQWIAMGFGSEMEGSNIFVMYKDGMGNVTVSPRAGKGEVEPLFNPHTKIELLAGTGIKDGMMTANVKCMNCEKWQGGQVDFDSKSESFIEAYRTGPAIDSTSESATIMQHQIIGHSYQWDMTAAKGGSPINPFSSKALASETAATGPQATAMTSETSEEAEESEENMMIKAHAIIMSLTVVVLFPLGAMAMRIFTFNGLIWAHAAWQMLCLCLLTAGFGIGYYEAGVLDERYKAPGFNHTVLGTVVFAFFWLQPFLGLGHHLRFRQVKKRNGVSHMHIWWGRFIFILAIINGGLGLILSANTTGGEIAYGVVAGIMFLLYVGVAIFGEVSRAKRVKAETKETKQYYPTS